MVMVTLHFLLDALAQSCIIINRYPYQALRRGVECEKSLEKSHLNMHAFPYAYEFGKNPSEINEYFRILYEPCLKDHRPIHRPLIACTHHLHSWIGNKFITGWQAAKASLCRISCPIGSVATCVSTSVGISYPCYLKRN